MSFSIAISVIDVASEEAERHGGRVTAVHLRLGPLSGVVKEALLSAYESAREGSALADAKLVVEETPIVAWCPTCHAERTIPSMPAVELPGRQFSDAGGSKRCRA